MRRGVHQKQYLSQVHRSALPTVILVAVQVEHFFALHRQDSTEDAFGETGSQEYNIIFFVLGRVSFEWYHRMR